MERSAIVDGAADATHLERFHRRIADCAARLPTARAAERLQANGLLSGGLRAQLAPPLREALDAAARANLARSLQAIAGFQDAVDALAEAQVAVCPLKGIELLGTVYAAEPEARVLSDVDILVPENEVERAVATLAERLGYREEPTAPGGNAPRHERSLVRESPSGPRQRLDVHSCLGRRFATKGTWRTLRPHPGELHDRPLWRLDAPSTFVHLAAHAANHGVGARLAWLEDLVRLGAWIEAAAGEGTEPVSGASRPGSATPFAHSVERATVEELVGWADALGARRALHAALAAVRRLSGPSFLSDVRPAAKDHLPLWLYARIALPRENAMLVSRPHRTRLRLASLLLADSPKQALRIARIATFHGAFPRRRDSS